MKSLPRTWSVLPLLLATLAFPVVPQSSAVPGAQLAPLIGIVEQQALASEAGCRFARPDAPPDHYLFISDTTGTVLMNLAGQDVKLQLVRATSRRRFKSKYRDAKGDRFVELYRGGGASVRLVETITYPCRYGDTMCELVRMNAVITVTKDRRHETIRAEGGCGNGEP